MEKQSTVFKVVTFEGFSVTVPPPWQRRYLIGETAIGHQDTPLIAFSNFMAAARFAGTDYLIYLAVATNVRKPLYKYRASVFYNDEQQIAKYWQEPELFSSVTWPRCTVLCDSITPRKILSSNKVDAALREMRLR